jgi:hypothetical protein
MSATITRGSGFGGAGRDTAQGERRVLVFPASGNARLASFASELRARFARRSPQNDPFLFALSRRPVPRLAIDRSASVEFFGERRAYRIAIEASADTRVTVETGDFAIVANFVGQYITSRLSDEGAPAPTDEAPL